MNRIRKADYLILFIILVIAVAFRLYKINTPLADLHSWRQVDTSAVARNYVKTGIHLLTPTYDDFSNIQSGKENPRGLRFVEFPLYNAAIAFLYKTLPVLSLEIYGRLISIFFSLLILVIIYYLLYKEIGRTGAFFGSLTFAVFPFFVFFSRVVLPEMTALGLVFASILFLYFYSQSKTTIYNIIFYTLSLISFAFAVLITPTVIFYGLTLFYLFIKKYKFKTVKQIHFYLFFIISLAPFLLWRNYISKFPEGIPENLWLINIVNTFEGKKIIFLKPAFFRWIFFERINNLILGGYLSIFFILGIVKKHKNLFLYSILSSALLFLFVFEGGNVQHEYYQILILPAVAIFIGIGVDLLLKTKKVFINYYLLYGLVFIIFSASFFFSFYQVRDYYNYPQDITQIAKIIKTLTRENDKIITDTTGDTTLLYLSERKGSPAPFKDFEEFKKDGYKYFITFNSEVISKKKAEGKYKEIFENNKFAIFEL